MVSQKPSPRQQREARAEAEFGQYTFTFFQARATFHADGHTETLKSVRVVGPQGQEYWCCADRTSCTCPDFQRRGRETGTFCKHLHMVARFLRERKARRQEQAPAPAPAVPQVDEAAAATAAQREARRQRMLRDFDARD